MPRFSLPGNNGKITATYCVLCLRCLFGIVPFRVNLFYLDGQGAERGLSCFKASFTLGQRVTHNLLASLVLFELSLVIPQFDQALLQFLFLALQGRQQG